MTSFYNSNKTHLSLTALKNKFSEIGKVFCGEKVPDTEIKIVLSEVVKLNQSDNLQFAHLDFFCTDRPSARLVISVFLPKLTGRTSVSLSLNIRFLCTYTNYACNLGTFSFGLQYLPPMQNVFLFLYILL